MYVMLCVCVCDCGGRGDTGYDTVCYVCVILCVGEGRGMYVYMYGRDYTVCI